MTSVWPNRLEIPSRWSLPVPTSFFVVTSSAVDISRADPNAMKIHIRARHELLAREEERR